MKGLMAKLKNMPIKRILIAHGEKFVLGTVGLIVLLALTSTTWGGFDKQPDELLTKATAAGQALHTGAWPEERQAAFKPSTYQAAAMSMYDELNLVDSMSPFAFDKPMSFPIYAREKPREEPEWPAVQHLISDSSRMVLGVNPPAPTFEEMEAEAAEAQVAKPATGAMAKANKRKGKGAEMDEMMITSPMMGTEGMMGMGASTGLQPRGQRYVALRGIVNLFDIGKAIQKALNLETVPEGIAMVVVEDFKIERQKAIAGPDPWTNAPWEEVKLDRADEVLSECGQAADLVITECIDPVFTMPLPTRLDGDYTTIVSHPSLEQFQLTKEQRELEQQFNSQLINSAGELGLQDQQGKRRGFINNQYDINGLRGSMSAETVNDAYKKVSAGRPGMPGGMPGMPGMPNRMNMGAGRPGAGMGTPTMPAMGGMNRPMMGGTAPVMGMGAGMGMGGMPGMGGMNNGMTPQLGEKAAGYLMLFRYLDFEVNPGEAYRYRVKLEFANPNYGMSLDKVKEPSVLEGETRMTEWSEPSAPVVIESDTNVFLTDLDKRGRTRGEARIRIYQWDPSLGTYIDSKLVSKFGQFIGGLASSVRLDLGMPSYKDRQTLFATRDFLLDTAVPPVILSSENPDLNLNVDAKQAKEGLDLPFEAIMLDEYGRLKVLDSVTEKSAETVVDKKIKAEREPWEYLKDTGEAKTGLNSLDAEGAMPGMMMPGMMGGPKSALKRGKAARGGAGAGVSPMLPGMGAGAGTRPGTKPMRGGRGMEK